MLKIKDNNKIRIIFVILCAIIILLIPNFIRFFYFDNFMLGEISYYHANVAQDIISNDYNIEESGFNAYNYIIAYTGKYTNILTATNFIPFFAGILSIFFFYILLQNLNFNLNKTTLITLFWIISPIFIFSFTVSNPFSIIILLNISGFYFFTRKKYSWVSIFVFCLIPFFGVEHTLLTSIFILFYTFKNKNKLIISTISIILLICISFLIISHFGYTPPKNIILEDSNIIQNNLVGLGAILGFNIFVIILSAIGIIKSWRKKHAFLSIYIIIILLFTTSYYLDSQFKMILNILFSVYAALGFIIILKMKWEEKLIKSLTLFILIIGILFASFSYIHRLSYMEPNIETIETLTWLKSNSNPNENVLSHHKNGFLIEFFSSKTATITSFSNQKLFNETNLLFKLRNEEKIIEILNKYEIKYIIVDQKTKDLMIDNNNRLGLEFLMKNSAMFKKIKDNKNVDIWKYQKSTY
jgi:hypothetical protein